MVSLVIALLALLALPAAAQTAIDGDTLILPAGPSTPACSRLRADGMERVRVLPHDAPELDHPRCEVERIMAEHSKARLDELLRSGTVTIIRQGCDAFRRTKARVFVDGRDVADIMLGEGLVIPYVPHQSTVRPGPWCGGR